MICAGGMSCIWNLSPHSAKTQSTLTSKVSFKGMVTGKWKACLHCQQSMSNHLHSHALITWFWSQNHSNLQILKEKNTTLCKFTLTLKGFSAAVVQTVEGIWWGVWIHQRIKLSELLHFSLSQEGKIGSTSFWDHEKYYFFQVSCLFTICCKYPPLTH